MHDYPIAQLHYGLEEDGARAGEPRHFVRFADADRPRARRMTAEEIVSSLRRQSAKCAWVSLGGIGPTTPLDPALIDALHAAGYRVAVETAGDVALPTGVDWIALVPKVAEHAVRQLTANEVRYTRGHGQGIPKPAVEAEHRLLSPALDHDRVDPRALAWCVALVKENPTWRLWIPGRASRLAAPVIAASPAFAPSSPSSSLADVGVERSPS